MIFLSTHGSHHVDADAASPRSVASHLAARHVSAPIASALELRLHWGGRAAAPARAVPYATYASSNERRGMKEAKRASVDVLKGNLRGQGRPAASIIHPLERNKGSPKGA